MTKYDAIDYIRSLKDSGISMNDASVEMHGDDELIECRGGTDTVGSALNGHEDWYLRCIYKREEGLSEITRETNAFISYLKELGQPERAEQELEDVNQFAEEAG